MLLVTALACCSVVQSNQALFVTCSNDLGMKVLGPLAVSQPGNVMISPLSISLGVSLVNVGAAGETRRQIEEALGVPSGGGAEYVAAIRPLMGALNSSKDAEVSVANSIWVNQHLRIRPGYAEFASQNLGAGIDSIDFSSSGAVDRINKWVRDNTRGMIKKVLSGVSRDTQVVVANAVAFKGFWMESFYDKATKPAPFMNIDGEKKEVPMMQLKGTTRYAESPGVQMLNLRYRGGFSMSIFLPAAGSDFRRFVGTVRARDLTSLIRIAQPVLVDYTIPKWKSTFEKDIRSDMARLGMSDAFQPDAANFSNLADSRSYINLLLHKTYIDVHEKGTEAAAVTVGGAGSGGGPKPPEPKIFLANRPFLYVITHDASGTMCFLGVVKNLQPEAKPEPDKM